jgi:xanthine dehydrogenase accessory factor
LGSRTPPEIAVSILAEVTAVKNVVTLQRLLRIEGAKKEWETAQRATSANTAYYTYRIGLRV